MLRRASLAEARKPTTSLGLHLPICPHATALRALCVVGAVVGRFRHRSGDNNGKRLAATAFSTGVPIRGDDVHNLPQT
jgi:hypothetical protein